MARDKGEDPELALIRLEQERTWLRLSDEVDRLVKAAQERQGKKRKSKGPYG